MLNVATFAGCGLMRRATTIGAITHIWPITRPLFAPSERPLAVRANFLGQQLLIVGISFHCNKENYRSSALWNAHYVDDLSKGTLALKANINASAEASWR